MCQFGCSVPFFPRLFWSFIFIALMSSGANSLYAKNFESDDALSLSFNVNGFSLLARLDKNNQLLEKISTPLDESEQHHYKGHLSGYPNSSVRVSFSNNRWQGILLVEEELYIVDAEQNPMASRSGGLHTYQADNEKSGKTCASGTINDSHSLTHTSNTQSALYTDTNNSQINSSYFTIASATLSDVCANQINGVCLLPEIELAYDLSYQNLPSNETPMQRALRELNEMELFFQNGLNYQFSRISLTMLNPAQDSLIGSSDDPNDLLDRLRILRGSNQLSYLRQSRSIFHLVTGRDFSGVDDNVVGIAYLDQVCQSFGLNTGITDAGDTSLVSLVMAHEIGHNLGAEHDSVATNGCPENRNVMSASLGFQASGFTGFSSCSIDTINQSVSADLSGLCFSFPIDLGLTASPDNPVSPNSDTPFDLVYSINADDGYIAIGVVTISGVLVDTSAGQLINAVVEDGNCSTTLSSYNCVINNPTNGFELTVTASANQSAVELTLQHSIGTTTAYVTDVVPENNTLNVTLHSFGQPNSAEAPNDDEPEATNTSQSSNGGGGAIGPLGLILFVTVLVRRKLKWLV